MAVEIYRTTVVWCGGSDARGPCPRDRHVDPTPPHSPGCPGPGRCSGLCRAPACPQPEHPGSNVAVVQPPAALGRTDDLLRPPGSPRGPELLRFVVQALQESGAPARTQLPKALR